MITYEVVTSGALPPVVIDMVPYRMKFAEKTSRLMSPFSKDETGHESGTLHPFKPILAVPGMAHFLPSHEGSKDVSS